MIDMGRKKKLPQIEVRTAPNGYSLAIEGHKQEYFYFSPDKLLEGIMVHIGLKMTDQLNMENVKDFLTTAIEWHDAEKRIKEIDRLKAALSAMTSKRNGLARQMRDERARYISLYNDLTIIRDAAKPSTDNMLKELTDTIAKRHRQMPALTYERLGVDSGDSGDVIPDDDDEETDESATTGE